MCNTIEKLRHTWYNSAELGFNLQLNNLLYITPFGVILIFFMRCTLCGRQQGGKLCKQQAKEERTSVHWRSERF